MMSSFGLVEPLQVFCFVESHRLYGQHPQCSHCQLNLQGVCKAVGATSDCQSCAHAAQTAAWMPLHLCPAVRGLQEARHTRQPLQATWCSRRRALARSRARKCQCRTSICMSMTSFVQPVVVNLCRSTIRHEGLQNLHIPEPSQVERNHAEPSHPEYMPMAQLRGQSSRPEPYAMDYSSP